MFICLFVGGPADREVRALPGERRVCEVLETSDCYASLAYDEGPGAPYPLRPQFTKHVYFAETLRLPDDANGRMVERHIMRHENLTLTKAIDQILTSYSEQGNRKR